MLTRTEIADIFRNMGYDHPSDQEIRAIESVCSLGAEYGYGNLMSWLKTAWDVTILRLYGVAEYEPRMVEPFPIPDSVSVKKQEAHEQQD